MDNNQWRMNEPESENEQREAPARLVQALADLNKKRLFIPPATDEAVLSEARRHFRKFDIRRSRSRSWGRWAALAASLALGAWLVQTWTGARRSAPAVSTNVPGDIDGNGAVDILDAFALARLMEHDPSRAQQWDLNGDGKIDSLDVELVALRAVNLEEKSL
jgi:hypothetical protein